MKLHLLLVHTSVRRSYVGMELSTIKTTPSLKQNVHISALDSAGSVAAIKAL